jgi:hypothetical protein
VLVSIIDGIAGGPAVQLRRCLVGRMATLATPIEQYQGEQAEAAATPWDVGQRREGCCQFARTARQATRACFRDLCSKARRHVAGRPAGCPAPRGMWVVALVSRTEIVYTAARYPQGGQCLLYSLGADNR